nr:hypothetical protein CFP56_21260 [Quercus suber]
MLKRPRYHYIDSVDTSTANRWTDVDSASFKRQTAVRKAVQHTQRALSCRHHANGHAYLLLLAAPDCRTLQETPS